MSATALQKHTVTSLTFGKQLSLLKAVLANTDNPKQNALQKRECKEATF